MRLASGFQSSHIGREGPFACKSTIVLSVRYRCVCYRLRSHRKPHHEQRTPAGLVLASNLSLMILHHAVDGAQSQTCALADGLRSIEGIEHAMRFFYSRPAIGKLHNHFLCLKLGADLEQASARLLQRIQGIFDDLHKRLK